MDIRKVTETIICTLLSIAVDKDETDGHNINACPERPFGPAVCEFLREVVDLSFKAALYDKRQAAEEPSREETSG